MALTKAEIAEALFDQLGLNKREARGRVRALVRRHHDTRVVVLDASAIADIDVTAGRMLGELRDELQARDVRLVVAHPVGELYDLLVGDDLRVDFTAGDMFDTVDEAVAAAGPAAACASPQAT